MFLLNKKVIKSGLDINRSMEKIDSFRFMKKKDFNLFQMWIDKSIRKMFNINLLNSLGTVHAFIR